MNTHLSTADSLLSIYRTAFKHSLQGFCLLERVDTSATAPPDFRYLLTNVAFEQQTGLQQPEGKTIRQREPLVEAHRLEDYDRVALTGQPSHFETYIPALDRWIEGDAFRVGESKLVWIGVLFTNITQRKRREADLAFLAEVSQDLAQLTDIDQTMNALGEKIAQYLGLSACVFGEIFGENEAQITEINHGWNRADTPSLLGTYQMSEFMTLEMIRMCRSSESIVIRDVFADPKTDGAQFAAINVGSFVGIPFVRDGEWRFLLVVYRSEPHDWSDDEIELTRELMTRIWTRLERARAEEALRLEDRRKDEFMAMLGHELRNPLAVMTNTLLLLELTQGADASLSYDKAVRLMSREANHLNRMVDDLLDVGRIRQGKIKLERKRIELGELVGQTVEAAQPLYQKSNCQLVLHLPSRPMYVQGDATRLTQVVMNLLTNGAKYTPEGGHVWVSLEAQGPYARLRVRDDGLGIPKEEQKAIFEVFVQGNTSLDRPQGGLGLGLAVVKQLVQGHGGSVEVFSEGPGQGSEFRIELPLMDVSPLPAQRPLKAQASPSRGRVLVVDDNKDLADMTARLIELKGYEVHVRYGGPQGLEAAESLGPDVILLDIGMPDLDGYAVCRRIRSQPWGERMTMVALTGFGQEADQQASRAAGFDEHLLKPVDYSLLLAVLARSMPGEPTA